MAYSFERRPHLLTGDANDVVYSSHSPAEKQPESRMPEPILTAARSPRRSDPAQYADGLEYPRQRGGLPARCGHQRQEWRYDRLRFQPQRSDHHADQRPVDDQQEPG